MRHDHLNFHGLQLWLHKKMRRIKVLLLMLPTLGIIFLSMGENQVTYAPTDRELIQNYNKTKENTSFGIKVQIFNNILKNLFENIGFFRNYNQSYVGYQRQMNLRTCSIYNADAEHKRFVIPSIWKNYLSVKLDDITFVTQLSFNRFYLIELIAKQWSGPLSIAIYVQVDHLPSFEKVFLTYPSLVDRDNLDIHLVLASGVSIVEAKEISPFEVPSPLSFIPESLFIQIRFCD